ncbi:hypothetical protein [Streptacidiphilus fuscans]|uniref:Uncharacterized protein n=1 Tax=Streptacidiphilus fuscans TaxID=2789292 RepID=A0A931FGG0_9ACTN|nr:hypothetical protein [Streptacidiphilus fuscans]MBF9072588.1 hypothetical protein [Streptacidiphilus fuscans]
MAWYQGRCRITVTAVEGDRPQRAVVTVRGSRRTIVVPGTAGESQIVDEDSWDLAVEHRIDGEWHPNIRAVQSRWQESGGVTSQLVRSKDRDRPGDRRDRTLVLRLERLERDIPAARPTEVLEDRPTVRTTAGGLGRTAGGPGRVSTTASGPDAPAPAPAPVRTTTSGSTTTSGGTTLTSSGF